MREFVADVGNTRIKTAEATDTGLQNPKAYPLDHLKVLERFDASAKEFSNWTMAGTNPDGRDRLARFWRGCGHRIRIVDDYRELPLKVLVDQPEQVGIDRLLNAVALLPKVPRGTPIVIIDAGSAVTVDLVDSDGAFRGGAILPGFRLMAKALNDYTAKLPLIETFTSEPQLPGTNTVAAIEAGITHAIRGGIERIVARYVQLFGQPRVFVAGGDADRLIDLKCGPEMAGPFLTLEGIRITAEVLKKMSC